MYSDELASPSYQQNSRYQPKKRRYLYNIWFLDETETVNVRIFLQTRYSL